METVIAKSFTIGIWDSLNPCGLASMLIYCILIATLCPNRNLIRIMTLSYMAAQFIMFFNLLHAVFYDFYSINFIYDIARIVFIIYSLSFLIIGGLHFADWLQYKKVGHFNEAIIKVDQIILTEKGQSRFNSLILIFIFFLIGCLNAYLIGYWPIGSTLLTETAGDLATSHPFVAELGILAYAFFLMLPIILSSAFISIMMFSQAFREYLIKNFAMIKIIISSFFIAEGLGLGYIILR